VNSEDQKWRELCRQAIIQNDVNRLFSLFVKLDRATVREERRKREVKQSASFLTSDSKKEAAD
jgi:hypothetical protein